MGKYKLFGKTVTISDSTERFYEHLQLYLTSDDDIRAEFRSWYEQRGDIKAVAAGYINEIDALVDKYGISKVYPYFAKYGIYDVSKSVFEKETHDYSVALDALETVKDSHDEIIDRLEEERAYREERKDSRGRAIGGGFGVGGALGGMAAAGAINATTGMFHSIGNAIGNASSSSKALDSIKELYGESYHELLMGVLEAIKSVHLGFMDMVDERQPDYFTVDGHDIEKADAYLENAKHMPDKRDELLIQSFVASPISSDFYHYVFINIPEERDNIANIAEHFSVDLQECVEPTLRAMVTKEVLNDEEKARAVRAEMLTLLKKYNLDPDVSDALYDLDQSCVKRLCKGYKSANKEKCKAILDALEKYDASYDSKFDLLCDVKDRIRELDKLEMQKWIDKIGTTGNKDAWSNVLKQIEEFEAEEETKKPFLEQVKKKIKDIDVECLSKICGEVDSADEAACNLMKEQLDSYDAPDETKKPFIDKVSARIDAIWTAEDFERFLPLYQGTTPDDKDTIESSIKVIDETGRTEAKAIFIEALKALTQENVEAAARYAMAEEKGVFSSLVNMGKSGAYKKLTGDKAFSHPAIQSKVEELKEQKASSGGLFGGLKKSLFSAGKDSSTSSGASFCTECGTKLSDGAKFCPGCGKKIE